MGKPAPVTLPVPARQARSIEPTGAPANLEARLSP